jgi:hypothetical protein
MLAAIGLLAGCATPPHAQKAAPEPASIGPNYKAALPPDANKSAGVLIYHVTYAFKVGPDGRVHDAHVVDSESPARIVLASHQVLSGSTFKPCHSNALRNCEHQYTYRFIIPRVRIKRGGL